MVEEKYFLLSYQNFSHKEARFVFSMNAEGRLEELIKTKFVFPKKGEDCPLVITDTNQKTYLGIRFSGDGKLEIYGEGAETAKLQEISYKEMQEYVLAGRIMDGRVEINPFKF